MSADDPTEEERLELLRASEHAREIIGQNAKIVHPATTNHQPTPPQENV